MSPTSSQKAGETPQIVKLAMELQAALDTGLDYAALDIAGMWVVPQEAINVKITQLINEIEIIRKSGQEMTIEQSVQWVRELNYYRELQEQIKDQSLEFQRNALYYAQRQIDQRISTSIYSADLLIGNQILGTGAGFYNRLPVSEYAAIYSAIMGQLSPLKQLFDGLGTLTGEAVGNKLMEGLIAGKPLNTIAREMTEASNIGMKRALLITRTEILRAHRIATLYGFQQSGVVVKYKRIANKRTACMACLLLDGEIFTVASSFTDHPNGACAMIPIVEGVKEPSWLYGMDYFKRLDSEEQRERMGNTYYEMWQDKVFKLEDLPFYRKNNVWGDTPAIQPIWMLQGFNSYADKLQQLHQQMHG